MKDKEVLDSIEKLVYNRERYKPQKFFESLQHYEADDTICEDEPDRRGTMIGRILEAEQGKKQTWKDFKGNDTDN